MKLVNQKLIKNTNLKRVYHYIHQEPGVSRAQLAKYTHLSKTTVSTLVDELMSENFIIDTGVVDNCNVGRRPNSLHLKQDEHYVIVICWNESEVVGQIVDICGNCVAGGRLSVNTGDSYVSQSYQLFQEQLLSQISKERLLGVCIVVPAMIDPDNKEIYSTTLHFQREEDTNLIKELSSAFRKYPLAILNDTACTAYAEKVYANVQEKDFAFINFSRGIGAALFIDNSILGKATASYTQLGHYSIDPKGKHCSCGNRGCLEVMIGEDSLLERVKSIKNENTLKQMEQLSYRALGEVAMYGNQTARKVIEQIASDFSLALSNLVCLVHPKAIIIGGKGSDLGPVFLESIQESLKKIGFRKMLDSIKIRYSILDENACYYGAMKYFFDTYYDFTQDLRGQVFIG